MAALVNWATYFHKTGDFAYVAVVPLTAGDWTDIVMPPTETGLLMKVGWARKVTLSIIDKVSTERNGVFHEEDVDEPGCYTFSQDIVQDSTGCNLRILDTSGVAQNISIVVRLITK